METEKKSFLIYSDWYDTLRNLTDSEIGIITRRIFQYHLDEEPIDLNDKLSMAFSFMQIVFDRDSHKWIDKKSKLQKAGKKGGLAKQANARKARSAKPPLASQAILAVSVNVSVNDNVKEEIQKFISYRAEKKNPFTQNALDLFVNKLLKEFPTDELRIKTIQQSIMGGWTGIFKVNEDLPNEPDDGRKGALPLPRDYA